MILIPLKILYVHESQFPRRQMPQPAVFTPLMSRRSLMAIPFGLISWHTAIILCVACREVLPIPRSSPGFSSERTLPKRSTMPTLPLGRIQCTSRGPSSRSRPGTIRGQAYGTALSRAFPVIICGAMMISTQTYNGVHVVSERARFRCFLCQLGLVDLGYFGAMSTDGRDSQPSVVEWPT